MKDADVMHVFTISGSLRKGSHNSALLQAARALAPESILIDVYDGLASIPPYDDDVRLIGYPPDVAALRDVDMLIDYLGPSISQRSKDHHERPPG
jgi:chromate reductase, NAD(P)H dehydrogenase (quinone)